MTDTKHTPGPWTYRDVSGAGLQIFGTLPAGLKFDGTARGADGKTSFMTWTVRKEQMVQIADERWVQFVTGSWSEMQEANAQLIATSPEMLEALIATRALVSEAAMTGFNCSEGDWAERLFANQARLSGAIDRATGKKSALATV